MRPGPGDADEALERRPTELRGATAQQGGEIAGEGMEKPTPRAIWTRIQNCPALRLAAAPCVVRPRGDQETTSCPLMPLS